MNVPAAEPSLVFVIGASGRSGAALCRSLLADGVPFVPVVRNKARWRATGLPGTPRIADLTDPFDLSEALSPLSGEEGRVRGQAPEPPRIVSCAHARHAAAILAAAPPDASFVFLGSTRKFTRWPDAHGNGVLAGEAAFLASGRPGVMLHPTMIYGAQGENNVQRLAALLRWLPVVPLPAGGRALVQPIHQDDVTACIRSALRVTWATPDSMVIAGGQAVPYASFVEAVAARAGLRPRPILPVPTALLLAAVRIARLLPFLPRIGPDEIRRLTEDKAFDTDRMWETLGVATVSMAVGLARTPLR
jgi:nucleoside-diphosphate-sugar epimerase